MPATASLTKLPLFTDTHEHTKFETFKAKFWSRPQKHKVETCQHDNVCTYSPKNATLIKNNHQPTGVLRSSASRFGTTQRIPCFDGSKQPLQCRLDTRRILIHLTWTRCTRTVSNFLSCKAAFCHHQEKCKTAPKIPRTPENPK